MKLYIGGAYQGQAELAKAENPGGEIFSEFHNTIRSAVLEKNQEPRDFARRFCAAHPDTDWHDQIEHGKKIGLGTDEYELITI